MDAEETAKITSDQAKKNDPAWYAMCDQKRRNAIEPAYKMLTAKGFTMFTPLVNKVTRRGGKKVIDEVPFISDLLFVFSTPTELDAVIEKTPTLHYRFKKGGTYREHIIVRKDDMERFMNAVNTAKTKHYFSIGELPKEKIGSSVIVHGGALDGREVILKKMRGTRKKHVYVELPGFMYVEIELTDFDSLELTDK